MSKDKKNYSKVSGAFISQTLELNVGKTLNVKFNVLVNEKLLKEAMESAIEQYPVKDVPRKAVEIATEAMKRDYTGVVSAGATNGYFLIKLETGETKSFYQENVTEITVEGLTYKREKK